MERPFVSVGLCLQVCTAGMCTVAMQDFANPVLLNKATEDHFWPDITSVAVVQACSPTVSSAARHPAPKEWAGGPAIQP